LPNQNAIPKHDDALFGLGLRMALPTAVQSKSISKVIAGILEPMNFFEIHINFQIFHLLVL
jgi:hypothetical protein